MSLVSSDSLNISVQEPPTGKSAGIVISVRSLSPENIPLVFSRDAFHLASDRLGFVSLMHPAKNSEASLSFPKSVPVRFASITFVQSLKVFTAFSQEQRSSPVRSATVRDVHPSNIPLISVSFPPKLLLKSTVFSVVQPLNSLQNSGSIATKF